MNRWGYLWIAICLFVVVGCTIQSDQQDGFAVMFDRMPKINDENNLYYKGMIVGSIHSRTVGAGNVAKIIVTLKEDFARYNGNNLALYLRNGRLEVAKLTAIGQPLQNGDLLSGFSSRAGLNWFKFKTLISDRINAAKYRARNLNDRFGSS